MSHLSIAAVGIPLGCRLSVERYIHRARRPLALGQGAPPDSRVVGWATDHPAADSAADVDAMLGMVVETVNVAVVVIQWVVVVVIAIAWSWSL